MQADMYLFTQNTILWSRTRGQDLLRQTPEIWVPRLTRHVISLLTGCRGLTPGHALIRLIFDREALRAPAHSCADLSTHLRMAKAELSQLSKVLPARRPLLYPPAHHTL
jgi:hypothetical protein